MQVLAIAKVDENFVYSNITSLGIFRKASTPLKAFNVG